MCCMILLLKCKLTCCYSSKKFWVKGKMIKTTKRHVVNTSKLSSNKISATVSIWQRNTVKAESITESKTNSIRSAMLLIPKHCPPENKSRNAGDVRGWTYLKGESEHKPRWQEAWSVRICGRKRKISRKWMRGEWTRGRLARRFVALSYLVFRSDRLGASQSCFTSVQIETLHLQNLSLFLNLIT